MKRILELADKHPKAVAIALGSLLLTALLIVAVPRFESAANEHRINKLEQQKQQFLKERDEARANDLILQGKIEAKDEQIKDLTSRIEDSNQRVSNAHKETVSAKASYDRVRADAPHFNSIDDAGRVRELGSDLHGPNGLYPDTP